MVLRKRRCCSNLSRANMRNGWSDPLALGGGDTNLYVYAGSGPTDFTDPFGLQRYDAAPQPKTQKVTAGCMGARLLENFFGSTGYPTVTVALNVAAVAVLKPAIAALVPGPGWLYTTTAVGYDLYMVGKSYTDCKYGVPEPNPPGEIEQLPER